MKEFRCAVLAGSIFLLCAVGAGAAVIDRIAAIVEKQTLTVSEVSQMVDLRFFARKAATEDEHRREVLDALIAQALRFRDVERFGAQDIPKDTIEARLGDIRKRFDSPEAFDAALRKTELSLDEVRALVKRQLQVEAYIRERFLPLVFVTNEDIEAYYRGAWSQQRRERGLTIPPLAGVRDEIRIALRDQRLDIEIERWTTQLRARANVDVLAWK
jgi:hypothetical protein